METLTHWKRYRNPDYFGAYCFNYAGEERTLTIKMARKETIKGSDGKKQECLVVHWAENEKPFIINATNAKAITKVAKTPYVERWVGIRITLYVAQISAFGEDVEALRVRPFPPAPPQNQPSITLEQITQAQNDIMEAESLDELKQVYVSMDKALAKHPNVIEAKDKRKAELEQVKEQEGEV
jgi:hypothetical protein